ncbi:MAG: hypothetical protein ACTSUG_11745 [Candidatus Helarchaeota archaeon]
MDNKKINLKTNIIVLLIFITPLILLFVLFFLDDMPQFFGDLIRCMSTGTPLIFIGLPRINILFFLPKPFQIIPLSIPQLLDLILFFFIFHHIQLLIAPTIRHYYLIKEYELPLDIDIYFLNQEKNDNNLSIIDIEISRFYNLKRNFWKSGHYAIKEGIQNSFLVIGWRKIVNNKKTKISINFLNTKFKNFKFFIKKSIKTLFSYKFFFIFNKFIRFFIISSNFYLNSFFRLLTNFSRKKRYKIRINWKKTNLNFLWRCLNGI